MGIEQTTIGYHQIVPKETFVGTHFPSVVKLAQKFGYFTPNAAQKDVPSGAIITMPSIPSDNGGSHHPVDYVFKQVKKLADRLPFNGEARTLRFQLDSDSLRRVAEVPASEQGMFLDERSYQEVALSHYGPAWFKDKGYHVSSADLEFDLLALTLSRS